MPAAFLTPTIFGFLMVLFRATALCSVAPLYGMQTVPARIRLGVAVVLAYAAFVAAGAPQLQGWTRMSVLVGGAFIETVIGLCAGLAARFALEAAAAAGSLIAAATGLSFGATLDPLHGA